MSAQPIEKRRPLFAIVADVQAAIDAAEGEVTDAVDALEGEFSDKVEAYHVVMQAYIAKQRANDATAAFFETKAAIAGRAAERLKARIEVGMKAAGISVVETQTVKVDFSTSTRVHIADEELFCATAEDRFVNPGKPSPKKAEVAKALKAKEVVEGASLVTEQHLRIR